MRLSMLRARITALLAVLLAVWPVTAHAHARYFCRAMDRIMDSCCCASEASSSAVRREPELRRPDCCVRLKQGALPQADARRDLMQPLAAPVLLPAPEIELFPPFDVERFAVIREEQRPVPARGPPLFLQNCVLLI